MPKIQMQLKRIKGSDLVIIDDLMYMAMDQREANVLFHLINHLYERSSIILTSNKGLEQWGELMGDQGITTAILDRLLHRVEVIQLNDNDSYRIKHRTTIFGKDSVQN
ncbi:transposase (27) [Bacillus methanolicus PB1]|uniref:Transposase (27) n=1 Tax=Bacillus methanolicus PB1 TaxID=997296 RepID=I3E1K9_BACMT|nr:transposase (27) [Bacillus methanolicus PB1]